MVSPAFSANSTSYRVEPVTASIIHGALEAVAVEMGFKLMRMAYSSIIRESEDFGAALCDPQGRQLCECAKSTPLQSGPIPGYVRGIRQVFEERGDTFKPGDVIIHNDPYQGASHSPDVAFCVPVFDQDVLIGFSVTTAHHMDLGSAQPGSMGLVECVDRYAEGLCFRALKLVDGGRKNETLWCLIKDNVRLQQFVLGDMEAQIAACEIGAGRFLDVYLQYGPSTFWGAVEDLLDYSERLMRVQIQKIPDGIYQAIGHIDGFIDNPDDSLKMLAIHVTLVVEGSNITVDFTGTANQLDHYAVNMPFRGTVDVATWLVLRTILLDSVEFGNIPQNDGLFRPITIHAPHGTLVNPIEPAPTIARAVGGNKVADTVMHALAKAVPDLVCAGTGSVRGIAFTGAKDSQQWVHLEILEGAYGGRQGGDGMDSVDTLYANTRNNPIEDIESHVPLRVRRYEFNERAVASGQWRGGLNSVKEFEFLCDGSLSAEGDNTLVAAWGFNGGQNGYNSQLSLIKVSGDVVALPSMMSSVRVKAGDRIVAIGGTGGGYGSPLRRDPVDVLSDVLDDLISIEQAEQDYGVFMHGQTIDMERTMHERQKRLA